MSYKRLARYLKRMNKKRFARYIDRELQDPQLAVTVLRKIMQTRPEVKPKPKLITL